MEEFEKIAAANQVFTPGAPVQQKDLFSGRTAQLGRVIETLAAPGRHPIIFGQRGVGKTSLANILGDTFQGLISVKVSCDGSDVFSTIWNRVLNKASVTFKQKAFGFSKEEATRTISLGQLLDHDPATTKPAEIADLVSQVEEYCIIILDEFDKVQDAQTKSSFADLIKIISDNVPRITLILVGVADNIHELIGEHPSIERNLVQIDMPIMSDEEIRVIVENGFKTLSLTAENGVIDQVPLLSNGYPHYAHLIGLSAATACARNGTQTVTQELFDVACNLAIEDAIERYRDAYAKATMTTQPSRYPLILCACGYARSDDRGVFRATDVVDAMSDVFNEYLTVQAVVPALGEFLTPDRGSVLDAVQIGNRKAYQFQDPMMRPFCRLKAKDLLLTL